jgi:hypothetical protein
MLFQAPAKGVAAAVGGLQPGVETLQDASMYYGAYPAYAYGGNCLFSSWCPVLDFVVKCYANSLFTILGF